MDAFVAALQKECEGLPPTVVMEVCGTHTQAVARSALRQVLPASLRLVSGPGCPVCVTDDADIAAAIWLAREKGVVLMTFGDMLRVPTAEGDSLLRAREHGADVRIALSPMDALDRAEREPDREVVWFAVGFETTAPLTAAMVLAAQARGVRNLSVLSVHKTMPQALRALLSGTDRVDALLCPGHVATITGADAYRFVPEELHMPAAVAGFEPREILAALCAIARMRRGGICDLRNLYPAAVTPGGNRAAQALLEKVFVPGDARWRGLGVIPGSGLTLAAPYAGLDARSRFGPPRFAEGGERPGCRCAAILRGEAAPEDCPLYGRVCTPEAPAGPCMVSSEGACAARYRYGG